MKKIIKTLTATAFTISALTAAAQSNMNELLEHLQIHEDTPLMELNVGQLIQIVNFSPFVTQVCADFSSQPLYQTYSNGQIVTINNVDFINNYTGGARISEWDGYGNDHFLEMVEDGSITIALPGAVTAREVNLKIIQASSNMPIYIEYFNNGSLVGSTTTTFNNNQIELIHFSEAEVDSVVLHNYELLISEFCYK